MNGDRVPKEIMPFAKTFRSARITRRPDFMFSCRRRLFFRGFQPYGLNLLKDWSDARGDVAAGHFLSKWQDVHDCTGIELRRITLAGDHSQRRFFLANAGCRGRERVRTTGSKRRRHRELLREAFDSELGLVSFFRLASGTQRDAPCDLF